MYMLIFLFNDHKHIPLKKLYFLKKTLRKQNKYFPAFIITACCPRIEHIIIFKNLENNDRRNYSNVSYPLGKCYCYYYARNVLSLVKGITDL